MSSLEELLENAKMAEQAERYDDMVENMKKVVHQKKSEKLAVEERNLLSVAYKNIVGARRSAWRIISSIVQRKEGKSEDVSLEKEYRKKIEGELEEKCQEVLTLIDEYMSGKGDDADGEELVFFYKMKGDYLRYLIEVMEGEKRDKTADLSMEAYNEATKHAEQSLPATHPIRLGLALNFSVFFYEIRNESDKACELAKNAFDNAVTQLDQMKDDSYKDSTLIMQLLRDNLTLWTDKENDDQEAD